MIYDEALNEIDSIKAEGIDKVWKRWRDEDPSRAHSIIESIKQERFLPPELMRNALERLIDCDTTSNVSKTYISFCDSNQKKGGEVTGRDRIGKLGTVFDKDKFTDLVKKNYFGNNFDPLIAGKSIDGFIKDILSMKIEELDIVYGISYREIMLKKRGVIWCTWGKNNGIDSHPFEFVEDHIDRSRYEIQLCLGLDPENYPKNKSILLVMYQSSTTENLYRPTIADARGNKYFCPPASDCNSCGMSRPSDELEKFYQPLILQANSSRSSYACERRPEAVIEQISMSLLVEVLEIK
jgi:hypothetical protein